MSALQAKNWEPSSFESSHGDGLKIARYGFVYGPFGIDKRDEFGGWCANRWVLTHVPTGHSLGAYDRKDQVRRAARILEKMAGLEFFQRSAWTVEEWNSRPRGMNEALDAIGRLSSPTLVGPPIKKDAA